MRGFWMIGGMGLVLGLGACQNEARQNEARQNDAEATTAVPETARTSAAAGPSAMATLKTADGRSAGQAIVTQDPAGLRMVLDVQGMPMGSHGVHIHETGSCDGPDFKSAGGHWNPTGKKHGLANDAGSHMGDFDNLSVGANGAGHLEGPIAGAALSGGPNALLDGDGAAFIVHAGKDDQMTDPSGDSGDRLACGVFQLSPG